MAAVVGGEVDDCQEKSDVEDVAEPLYCHMEKIPRRKRVSEACEISTATS